MDEEARRTCGVFFHTGCGFDCTARPPDVGTTHAFPNAGVAQCRAPPFQGGGRDFKTHRPLHFFPDLEAFYNLAVRGFPPELNCRYGWGHG